MFKRQTNEYETVLYFNDLRYVIVTVFNFCTLKSLTNATVVIQICVLFMIYLLGFRIDLSQINIALKWFCHFTILKLQGINILQQIILLINA